MQNNFIFWKCFFLYEKKHIQRILSLISLGLVLHPLTFPWTSPIKDRCLFPYSGFYPVQSLLSNSRGQFSLDPVPARFCHSSCFLVLYYRMHKVVPWFSLSFSSFLSIFGWRWCSWRHIRKILFGPLACGSSNSLFVTTFFIKQTLVFAEEMVAFKKSVWCFISVFGVWLWEASITMSLLWILFHCMQGMGDFLNEMAVMMSQTKSNVSLNLFFWGKKLIN